MERVSFSYLFGDLLDARRNDVAAILGLLDLLGILFGDVRNGAFVGQFIDETLFQNLVDFVARQLDWGDGHCLAPGFLLEVGNRLGQCFGLGLIATREVGNDDSAVR